LIKRKGGSGLAIIHLIDSNILESIAPQYIKPLKSFPSPPPGILLGVIFWSPSQLKRK